jgi:hypothetical protein
MKQKFKNSVPEVKVQEEGNRILTALSMPKYKQNPSCSDLIDLARPQRKQSKDAGEHKS